MAYDSTLASAHVDRSPSGQSGNARLIDTLDCFAALNEVHIECLIQQLIQTIIPEFASPNPGCRESRARPSSGFCLPWACPGASAPFAG